METTRMEILPGEPKTCVSWEPAAYGETVTVTRRGREGYQHVQITHRGRVWNYRPLDNRAGSRLEMILRRFPIRRFVLCVNGEEEVLFGQEEEGT